MTLVDVGLDGVDRYRRMIQASAVPTCLLGRDGSVLEVNPAAEQFFEFTAEQLRHMSWLGLSHPDDMQARRETLACVLEATEEASHAAQVCHAGSTRFLTGSGSVRTAGATLSGLRDGQGHVTHFVAHIVDSRMARPEVPEPRHDGLERLDEVLDCLSVPIALVDSTGLICCTNQDFAAQTAQWCGSEIKHIQEAVAQDHRAAVRRYVLNASRQHDGSQRSASLHVRAARGEATMRINARPVNGASVEERLVALTITPLEPR